MRNYILLFVNGEQHRVSGADAFLTLSDFLRLRLKRCGTKIVCSEGDCGSCSVLFGKLSPIDEAVEYLPIDSCIRFVYQFDGCHIVTVEGLNGCGKNAAALNGVQRGMIDCHGSQCGFCTPGFVVAMTGLLEQTKEPSVNDWRQALTGNLCRCTGYTPIIEAGQRTNIENTPGINSIYPLRQLLPGAKKSLDDTIKVETEEPERQIAFCPTTIADAVEFLDSYPDAKIVAGSTDVGVQFNKGHCHSKIWLDLSRITELQTAALEGDLIVSGACATWRQWELLSKQLAPQFHKIISIFGSPQIRHVGTIGGNIVNASPIADSLPFLFVCNAELEMRGTQGTRRVLINDFYSGYKQFDLRPGELLTQIRIPLPKPETQLRLYKVSRRRDLDISTFTAAIAMDINDDRIESANIAYGAVGPVVLRLPKTEAFLADKEFSIDVMKAAGDLAVNEITPISDVRGSIDFRLQLARNILQKFYHETVIEGVVA